MKKIFFRKILFIIISFFTINCTEYKLSGHESNNNIIDNNLLTDDFSQLQLKKFKDTLEKEMNEVINYCNKELDVGSPEGLLGNFIADLSLISVKSINNIKNSPDFCVLNNGGLRTSMNKGPVTRGNIYEIMPFDNHFVIIKIEPKTMNELLSYIKNRSFMGESRKAGVPVSGIRIRITNNDIDKCMINNQEIDNKKSYYVLTTDYLANGGDGMVFFKSCKNKYPLKILLRDVIIDYIMKIAEANITIDAQLDGRIEITE